MTVTNAIDTDAHGREIWSMNVLVALSAQTKTRLRIDQNSAATQTRCVLVHLLVGQSVSQTLCQHDAMDWMRVEMHSRSRISKILLRCDKTIVSIWNRCRAHSLMLTQLSQYFSIKINDDNNKIEKKMITKQKQHRNSTITIKQVKINCSAAPPIILILKWLAIVCMCVLFHRR